MSFCSHESVPVNVEMEMLSRILVRSNIVHCFSVLFSPIPSNYPPPIMAGPGYGGWFDPQKVDDNGSDQLSTFVSDDMRRGK